MIDNAQHLSGKCDGSNILLSAPWNTLRNNLFGFELFLVLDMAFANCSWSFNPLLDIIVATRKSLWISAPQTISFSVCV
jgi:hypothetical protein